MVATAFLAISILYEPIEPEVSIVKTTFFGIESNPSGAIQWTKYPLRTMTSPHESLRIGCEVVRSLPVEGLVEEHFHCDKVYQRVLAEFQEQHNPRVLGNVQPVIEKILKELLSICPYEHRVNKSRNMQIFFNTTHIQIKHT